MYYPFHTSAASNLIKINPTTHKRPAKINPRIAARPLDELIRPLWAESKGFQYIPRKDPARAIHWYPIRRHLTHAAGAVWIPLQNKTAFHLAPAVRLAHVATIHPPREFRAAPTTTATSLATFLILVSRWTTRVDQRRFKPYRPED